MTSLLNKTVRLADKASLFFANIAAIILIGLVVLTCVDVIGRYFFASPVVGAVELVRICRAGIIFFSFPLMFLRNDHIIVDLFTIFKQGLLAKITAVIMLIIIVYVAFRIGDRVFDYAVRAFEDEDVTEYLGLPRWPVVGFISVSIFAAAAMAMIRLLAVIFTPKQMPEQESAGEPS